MWEPYCEENFGGLLFVSTVIVFCEYVISVHLKVVSECQICSVIDTLDI